MPNYREFFHLSLAAFWAILRLSSADNDLALAFPPFNPPSLPSATAAGFFSGDVLASAVTCATMDAASWFTSLLERFSMAYNYPPAGQRQAKIRPSGFKLTHYPGS